MWELVRSEACDFLVLTGHLGSSRRLNFRPSSSRFRRASLTLINCKIDRSQGQGLLPLLTTTISANSRFQTLNQEHAPQKASILHPGPCPLRPRPCPIGSQLTFPPPPVQPPDPSICKLLCCTYTCLNSCWARLPLQIGLWFKTNKSKEPGGRSDEDISVVSTGGGVLTLTVSLK